MIRSDLNAGQRKAVETTEGPVLVIAGPGTGKTKTMVERARHLVLDCKVPASEITITTFTKKAAEELIGRLAEALREEGSFSDASVHAGNFHSITTELLREYLERTPWRPGFTVVDPTARLLMLSRFWERLRKADDGIFFGTPMFPDPRRTPGFYDFRAMGEALDQLREGFYDLSGHAPRVRAARMLLAEWRQILIEENRMDFSALLFECVMLLERDPEALAGAQRSCRYLMVDEYQDTNPIQERLLRLLSAKTGNLCVVGDDDQSLYRFRGTTVRNLLDFPKRYPGTTIVHLRENYRSDGEILRFASRYIDLPYEIAGTGEDRSEFRFPKELEAADGSMTRGAVCGLVAADESALVMHLVSRILGLRERVSSWRQMAILSHSVVSERMQELIRALKAAGVPLSIPREGGMFTFPEVARFTGCYWLLFFDMLERLADRGEERAEWEQCRKWAAEVPKRGEEERRALIHEVRGRMREGIDPVEIAHLLLGVSPFREIAEAAPEDGAAKEKLRRLGVWILRLKELCSERGFDRVDFSNAAEFLQGVFYEMLPLLRASKAEAIVGEAELSDDDRLPVLTIHQAKGLEFPIVFFVESIPRAKRYRKRPSLGDLLPPAPDATTSEDPETAERLDTLRRNYTAFTRAKDLLVICGTDAYAASDCAPGREDFSAEPEFLAMHLSLPDADAEPARIREKETAKIPRAYAYTTDIQSYTACPRRYFYERVVGIPEAFSPFAEYGSLVHLSLQEVHRRRTAEETEVRKIVMSVREGMEKNGARFGEGDEARAAAEILSYLGERGERWMRAGCLPEERVLCSEGEYLLKGVIDLLLDDGTVIDFKTGKPPESADGVPGYYADQIAYYRLLLERTGRKEENAKGILYYTAAPEGEREFEVRADAEKTDRLAEQVRAVVERIENGEFSRPTEDARNCKRCPMRRVCGQEAAEEA